MTEEEKAHIVAAAKSIAKRMKGKFVLNEATDTPEPPIYSGYIEEAEPPANLLSCPFCGAHPHHGLTKVEYDQLHGDPFQRGRVWCPKGHASVTSTNLAMAKAEWNKRFENPTPAEPPATVETDFAAQVAELREIVGRMTPGNWEHHTNELSHHGLGAEWIRASDQEGSWVVAAVEFGGDDAPSKQQIADAAGIVALRNTALSIIDALMAENGDLEAEKAIQQVTDQAIIDAQAAEIAALKAEIAELSEAYLELAMDGQTPETVKANRQKVGAWVARITAALAQVQP